MSTVLKYISIHVCSICVWRYSKRNFNLFRKSIEESRKAFDKWVYKINNDDKMNANNFWCLLWCIYLWQCCAWMPTSILILLHLYFMIILITKAYKIYMANKFSNCNNYICSKFYTNFTWYIIETHHQFFFIEDL